MEYTFVGKQDVISDAVKSYTEKKLDRLSKLMPNDTKVNVTYEVVKLDQKVEVTINLPKRMLRSEVVDLDMYAAIDKVADILENQLVKYKNRLKKSSSKNSKLKEEYTAIAFDETNIFEEETNIFKTKKFAIKPMDAEEAVMEMDLLGHNFYVFRNSHTDEVNVVYKRKDNQYGLIEPEF